ncbi:MAG TPA: geranylgeranyl reductase family protein [Caldithrix abyssi]|uniref:Geranylgeranyl reductase family protein n=1 Tax=Caldithrix abyssi TaxID=187145 RepID=A0A7V5H547_CALAY|nr:geranylgeranyl reductase family protein [Caldithrix abyssi]
MLFDTDITIVGAGPAGSTTSLFLVKQKVPHVILDKAEFPRDKICGDGLSGKVVSVIEDLNPQWLSEIQNDSDHFLDSWGVRFVAPNGQAIDLPFRTSKEQPKRAPGFISKRLHFDHFLFSQIDSQWAKVFLKTELKDVQRENGRLILHLEHNGKPVTARARLIVAAEGDRSVVARKLAGYRMQRSFYYAGLRAYYENVSDLHPQNFIELHFLDECLPGYFWIFPLPNNQANVGVGILASDIQKRRLNIKKIMQSAIENNPTIAHRFKNARLIDPMKGWGLPLGTVKHSLSGDNYLLTGDAGSLIDPFTGEGIGNAMFSARIAARLIPQFLAKGDFSAETLKKYDEEVYQRMWSELNLSATLQKLVRIRWLFNFVINRINSNPRLQETFSTMFNDLDNRAMLRSPLFYLRMLLNI